MDNMLKGAAVVCLTAITLACLAITIFLAVYLKAVIGTLPPPLPPMGPSMGSAWGPGPGMMPMLDASGKPIEGRAWGPEQATGEPDTTMMGDMITAWASLSTDDRDEWLTLTYEKEIVPVAVVVHETYNPGAVTKVTAGEGADGPVLWEGRDPVAFENGMAVSEIPLAAASPLKTITLHIASTDVPGWNEIDAVGLKDAQGTIHWATEAKASSTYAEQPGMMMR